MPGNHHASPRALLPIEILVHLTYVIIVQSQSNKVVDSEEYQQAKLAASDAEAVLA